MVPVINGALGKIKKGLHQNLQLLPGHRSAKDLQEVTLMSNCTQHSLSAGVNCFDVLLITPPPDKQARVNL
jgi:hypothetical protein